MPAIRFVFIRFGITVNKFFRIEFFNRCRGFDTLFYENRANYKSTAEKRAENNRGQKPKSCRRNVRHKQPTVCGNQRFDKQKRQYVRKPRSRGGKDKFHRVGVVSFTERRRNIARHRAIRHLRQGRASVPNKIHYQHIGDKPVRRHAPLRDRHKQKEYRYDYRNAAPEHIRLASAPLTTRVVADKAHHRVGYCVPQLRNHKYSGCDFNRYAHRRHVFDKNTRHQRNAAAVHKTAYAVTNFLFKRHSVFGHDIVRVAGDSHLFFLLFHVVPHTKRYINNIISFVLTQATKTYLTIYLL